MRPMTIEAGAENWQIFSQENGFAEICLEGKYDTEIRGEKYIRIVDEKTNEYVIDLVYVNASDGKWDVKIEVPAGATVSRYLVDFSSQLPALGFYKFKIENI